VVGVFLAAGVSQSHSVCSSSLGAFANQNDCATANLLFYGGIVAIIVGVILIAAAFLGGRREPTTRSAKPGWYEMPARPGWVAYWDGYKWVPGTARPPPQPPAPPSSSAGPTNE
jgi:hypothetical protein